MAGGRPPQGISWWQQPAVQRAIGIADIALGVLSLVGTLVLQSQGYEPELVFGILPYWVVPTGMILLGLAMIAGLGRRSRSIIRRDGE
jgi:hypothetical protein